MSRTGNSGRILATALSYLAATGSMAAEPVAPDAGLLEFLASWPDEKTGEEWLDFLENLPEEERSAVEAPKPDEPEPDIQPR